MGLEHLDRLGQDPTVDGRHELVTLRGRHESIRADGLALVIDHPDQQFVMRPGALRAGEWQYELRVEPEAARVDGIAQLACDVDISEPPHQARIVGMVDLDAVAASIFSGLARRFGGRERMHELAGTRVQQCHANTDRDVEPRVAVHGAEHFDTLAQ